jgi:hypothetical protein
MAASQISGFNMYTGDELESARAERVRDALRDAQDAIPPSRPQDAASERECDSLGGIWNASQETCFPP